MVYFGKRDETGRICQLGALPEGAEMPEGFELVSSEEGDAWRADFAERRATWEAEDSPTEAERLRADVDYLAVMTGVSLSGVAAVTLELTEETATEAETLARRYYPRLWDGGRIAALVAAEKLSEDAAAEILAVSKLDTGEKAGDGQ